MLSRLVLDTNVLVSGLCFSGPPRRLITLVLEAEVEIATSATLRTELERVLQAKFSHMRVAIQGTLGVLDTLTVLVHPTEDVAVISEDPSDNHVLACAIAAGANTIVSGDKHLLSLKTFRGIPILSPRAFLTQWHPA